VDDDEHFLADVRQIRFSYAEPPQHPPDERRRSLEDRGEVRRGTNLEDAYFVLMRGEVLEEAVR